MSDSEWSDLSVSSDSDNDDVFSSGSNDDYPVEMELSDENASNTISFEATDEEHNDSMNIGSDSDDNSGVASSNDAHSNLFDVSDETPAIFASSDNDSELGEFWQSSSSSSPFFGEPDAMSDMSFGIGSGTGSDEDFFRESRATESPNEDSDHNWMDAGTQSENSDDDVDFGPQTPPDTDNHDFLDPPSLIYFPRVSLSPIPENSTSGVDESIQEPYHPFMKCPICYRNIVDHRPWAFGCGHLSCESCIARLTATASPKCPICQQQFRITDIRRIFVS